MTAEVDGKIKTQAVFGASDLGIKTAVYEITLCGGKRVVLT